MTNPVLVILAGGASSRMWPLAEKSLVRFGAETLLEKQLATYTDLGFEQIIIVCNPQNHDLIRDETNALAGASVELVVQAVPTGMGDALLQAAPLLAAAGNPPLYVVQVHDVFDVALHRDMLAAHQQHPERSLLASHQRDTYFPGGYLVVDDALKIASIVEKPGPGNEPSDLVNIVAHLHTDPAALFEAIRAEYDRDLTTDDHYERAITALATTAPYYALPYSGEWVALKYPWHVLDVMTYFLGQITTTYISPDARIADGVNILGPVYIADGVRAFPGATIAGPAYIGANAIIGNGSLVRNSMVLGGCEVGFTTEVARSYVAANCGMHACRVLDSVFAPGVNFSAGCTTANLRIDQGEISSLVKGTPQQTGRNKLGAIIGEGSFVAVDAMTMPGIKLGRGTVVGPTTNVIDDLPDHHRIYVKQETVIKKGR